jgi:hypothetical protein
MLEIHSGELLRRTQSAIRRFKRQCTLTVVVRPAAVDVWAVGTRIAYYRTVHWISCNNVTVCVNYCTQANTRSNSSLL